MGCAWGDVKKLSTFGDDVSVKWVVWLFPVAGRSGSLFQFATEDAGGVACCDSTQQQYDGCDNEGVAPLQLHGVGFDDKCA